MGEVKLEEKRGNAEYICVPLVKYTRLFSIESFEPNIYSCFLFLIVVSYLVVDTSLVGGNVA